VTRGSLSASDNADTEGDLGDFMDSPGGRPGRRAVRSESLLAHVSTSPMRLGSKRGAAPPEGAVSGRHRDEWPTGVRGGAVTVAPRGLRHAGAASNRAAFAAQCHGYPLARPPARPPPPPPPPLESWVGLGSPKTKRTPGLCQRVFCVVSTTCARDGCCPKIDCTNVTADTGTNTGTNTGKKS